MPNKPLIKLVAEKARPYLTPFSRRDRPFSSFEFSEDESSLEISETEESSAVVISVLAPLKGRTEEEMENMQTKAHTIALRTIFPVTKFMKLPLGRSIRRSDHVIKPLFSMSWTGKDI
jgi:hypothetical protein